MEIKEKHPEQIDPAERASGSGRGTRGPLDRLALIAFSGFALMYFVVFFYALLVEQAFITGGRRRDAFNRLIAKKSTAYSPNLQMTTEKECDAFHTEIMNPATATKADFHDPYNKSASIR